MSRRRNFTLSEGELQVVEQAINSHPEAEVVKRAMALRLLHLGHCPQEVAAMLVVNLRTIYKWCRSWAAGGLDGLVNFPKSGRPRKADERYCHLLEVAFETDPAAYGYRFAVWTADRLRAHLEQKTGIRLSRGWFAWLMEALGYVYRRPKRDLAPKQDQEAKQQAADLLDKLTRGHQVALEHKQAVHARFQELARLAGAHTPEKLADQLLLLMDGAFMTVRMFGVNNPASHGAEAAETLIAAQI